MGSHVKSDNTHTIINIHPLAHILDICAFIFSSCALLTVNPTPLQVITTRARESGPKEHRANQKWRVKLIQLHMRIDAQPPPSFLCCPRSPSHHPSSLPRSSSYPSSTDFSHQHPSGHRVLIRSFHMLKPSKYSLICSTRQLLSIPALLPFLTLSIRDTPTKLPKHFTSRRFNFLLSVLLIPHSSAPYNAVGTITPSYRYFMALTPSPLLLSTLFSAPHALYPSFILCTTPLSDPPSADTCDPRYLKQSTSSSCLPFSITCIVSPLPTVQ